MPDNQTKKINPVLKRMIDYLNTNNIAPTKADKLMGSGNGRLGKMVLNNTIPKSEFIENFLRKFPDLSREWLRDERGEMLISTSINPNGIPMYDSAATASGVEVYNDLVQDEPAFVVNIPQFRDCSFGKLVYGHSMYPTIESGTYVFCKSVSNKLHILPGEIYYIEYDNYGVVKRLQKGDSPENVLAVSDNDEVRKDGSRRYESYTIPFDSIRNIYLIKGHFKQSHN
jgi:phage repressor protein C with HTH and peptisase S24 domain